MARTTPVHSGYSIINGAGTGPNGNRIDVWIEYAVISQDIVEQHIPGDRVLLRRSKSGIFVYDILRQFRVFLVQRKRCVRHEPEKQRRI